MTLEHIPHVLPYEESMFGTEAWSAQAYHEELSDPEHRDYRVIQREGEVLAWGGVRVIADEAEILTVGVVPQARRQGLARELLSELLAIAADRGAEQVYLEVRVDNEAAQQLYRGAGFTDLGLRRGYYDGGRVDALTMSKALTISNTPVISKAESSSDSPPIAKGGQHV